ncbi:hypothetical protein BH23ACT9_BH23ACT9_06330 [soil metagenome]
MASLLRMTGLNSAPALRPQLLSVTWIQDVGVTELQEERAGTGRP